MGRVMNNELLKYNDYELLYLASLEGEEAQTILFDKYLFMIKKMISRFNVSLRNRDDYEQEGLLMINKAIKTYNSSSPMTFTRYVEMLIYRRFIDLERSKKKKQEDIVGMDELDYIIDQPVLPMMLNESNLFDLSKLSTLEQKVYELKYFEGIDSAQIAGKLKIKIRQVYSASDRIKKKLRGQMHYLDSNMTTK